MSSLNSLPPLLHVVITDEGEAVNALVDPSAPLSPATALKRALRQSVLKCGGLLPPQGAGPVKTTSEALTLVVSVSLDLLSIVLENMPIGPAIDTRLAATLSKELPALADVCAQVLAQAGQPGPKFFVEAVELALAQSACARWNHYNVPATERGALYLAHFLQLMTLRVLGGAAKEHAKGSTLKARHVMAAMGKDAGLKSLLAPPPSAKPDAQGGCA